MFSAPPVGMFLRAQWFNCWFHSSRLTFTNPDKDDLGKYSVVVTDTDGVSSSHTLTEDGGWLHSTSVLSLALFFVCSFSVCLL